MTATTSPALPQLIAHRGLSAHAPENTLSAVRAAHANGIDWVELDAQLLGDGTPVIWHDRGVRRCSNGRGGLHKLDLAAAKALDVGAWFGEAFQGERMATLAEMLDLLAARDMGLNLELKVCRGRDPVALAEAVIPRLLEALPAERLIVSSFDARALATARALVPDPERLRLGVLFEKIPKAWQAEAERYAAFSLHADWTRLKPERARAIKASGYKLLCYTANDPQAFAPCWAWGVDSVISDDPRRFLATT